jgi:hypothetical protein
MSIAREEVVEFISYPRLLYFFTLLKTTAKETRRWTNKIRTKTYFVEIAGKFQPVNPEFFLCQSGKSRQ